MNIMKTLFLCQWFEAIVAKLMIIPFQIGVFKICDSTQPYVSWWSEEGSDEIIVIEKASTTVYLLIIASFLVWHYAYSMIFGILNLGLERIFATVLLKDYENKPRLYIPVLLICSTHAVTLVFSYLVLTNKTGFYIGTSPCFINSGLSFMMYVIVLKVNKRRRKKLEDPGPGCDYSLAQQFQVKENYRALKLAKNLLIVVLCAMSVPCALLIMLVIGLIPSFKMILIHVMENSIYLNPIIICTVLMFSSTVWRDEYLKLIPGWKRFRTARVFKVRPKPQLTHKASTAPVEPDEGLIYFEQLKKSWQ
ncbi:hypothetical protein GCK72_006695 [Caenorhabditis remanei]|uniref:Uncharacterized protein n=1 Tax=Caenorhabditis remanei TaxID=31234 RepID=A0A6A5HJG5_CAERE|nr:hypothetical protein GCK72_006695 [Caenorhabditis remanei]KAF1766737.1 hypothetical protein GCK72_006695 [Caenorhabditis remanei]